MWSGYEHGFCVQDLMILQDTHEPKYENFSCWINYPLPSCMWHMGCWRRRADITSIKFHCNWDCITLPQWWSFTHRSTSIRPLKQRDGIQLVYYRRQLQVELIPLHPKSAHFCRFFFFFTFQHISSMHSLCTAFFSHANFICLCLSILLIKEVVQGTWTSSSAAVSTFYQ